jgi:selenocysteine-specific elongation factor
LIVGTAGHIDHGKTRLVGALTGVDTDRLKEEKARGISIDLGFAYMPTPRGSIIGFVDVPGHEGFVHNMLAGASGIDFVLLVVAADDGVMPQTLEHLAIVDILGKDRGIAVITKADLVPADRLQAVMADVAGVLAGTALANIETVAVSAATGEGIDSLRKKLLATETSFAARGASGRFRLAVDRSFTLSGVGTVVTGTVRAGQVAVGDRVVVSPSGHEARVRSIHAQDRPVESGCAGDRCALNLAGERISKEAVGRGDFVLDPALHAPTDRIDAMLRLLPGETRPLRQWTPVRLHHGAVEVGARIVLLSDDPVRPGEQAPIQLVLERAIAASAGERYVVRDTSARRTMGGGRFLDLRAPQRRRRAPERRQQLQAHAITDPKAALSALLDCPPYFIDLSVFARDRGLTDDELEAILADGTIMQLAGQKTVLALSRSGWSAVRGKLVQALSRFHQERPNQQGMDLERLRVVVAPRLPRLAFPSLLRALARDGTVSLEGARVRLPNHSVSLSPEDERTWNEIDPLISGDGRFAPPRVRDIAKRISASEAHVRRVMKLAVQMGRVSEVSQDEFLTHPVIVDIIEIIGELSRTRPDGAFSAAEFRDALAVGRNVAIRILEYFDRQGLTVRQGDVRRVDQRRLGLLRSKFGGAEPADPTPSSGGEAFPVERPDFKSGKGRQPVFGGFDSHSLPPKS